MSRIAFFCFAGLLCLASFGLFIHLRPASEASRNAVNSSNSSVAKTFQIDEFWLPPNVTPADKSAGAALSDGTDRDKFVINNNGTIY
jgi:hypothetical protein